MGLPRILLYVVGRAMTALMAGFGLAWDYTGKSVLTVSSGDWGLIGLICMGVFVLITIFREVDLALQKRPKIVVQAKTDDNLAILEVHNIGGKANFTARAKIVDKILQSQSYYMCWDSITEIECPINKDGDASILVGSLTDEFKGYGPKPEREVVLFKMSGSGKGKLYLSSTEGNRELKLRNRYPTMKTKIPTEECILEVSITSEPSPVKAFKPNRYLFKIDHDNEDKLIFTPSLESTPDKEGSQT